MQFVYVGYASPIGSAGILVKFDGKPGKSKFPCLERLLKFPKGLAGLCLFKLYAANVDMRLYRLGQDLQIIVKVQ